MVITWGMVDDIGLTTFSWISWGISIMAVNLSIAHLKHPDTGHSRLSLSRRIFPTHFGPDKSTTWGNIASDREQHLFEAINWCEIGVHQLDPTCQKAKGGGLHIFSHNFVFLSKLLGFLQQWQQMPPAWGSTSWGVKRLAWCGWLCEHIPSQGKLKFRQNGLFWQSTLSVG